MNFNLSASIFLVFVIYGTVWSQKVKNYKIPEIKNFAAYAEELSDSQHEMFCSIHGENLKSNPSFWAEVQPECVNKAVLEVDYLSPSFPELADNILDEIKRIQFMCSRVVQNPCIDEKANETRKCFLKEVVRLMTFRMEHALLGATSELGSKMMQCFDRKFISKFLSNSTL